MRRPFFRKGVFSRYVFSYCTAVLAALLMVVAVLLTTSVNALNRQSEQAQISRLDYIADDMSARLDVFRSIALEAQMSKEFLPIRLKNEPINELNLIHTLAKYTGYTDLPFNLYLYYPELDVIYSTSAKTSFRVFAEYVIKADESQLRARIEGEGLSILAERWPEIPESLILNFPVPIYRTRARMLIMLDRAAFESHYATFYGVGSSQFNLCFDGETVLGSDLSRTQRFEKALHGYPKFVVSVVRDPLGKEAQGDLIMGLQLLAVGAVLLFALSIFLAYRSYKPILNILNSVIYHRTDVRNEFDLINEIIQSTLVSKNTTEKQLRNLAVVVHEQNQLIRDQLLSRMLHGEVGPDERELLESVDIHLKDGVLALVLADARVLQDPDGFTARLGTILDEDIRHLYPVYEKERAYLVAVLHDSGSAMYLMELLPTLLETGELSNFRLLGLAENIEKLAELCAGAEATDRKTEARPALSASEEGMLETLLGYAANGDTDDMLVLCRQLRDSLRARCGSDMEFRDAVADVNARVYAFSRQTGIKLSEAYAESVVGFHGICDYFTQLQMYLMEVSGGADREGSRESDKDVISYIQDNIGSYDLTLGKVADHFGMSERRATNIVREMTGYPYKEYVISKRMSRAADLLRDDSMSVQQVGQSVGYANISYFIRTFKTYYGVTPSAFRLYPRSEQ